MAVATVAGTACGDPRDHRIVWSEFCHWNTPETPWSGTYRRAGWELRLCADGSYRALNRYNASFCANCTWWLSTIELGVWHSLDNSLFLYGWAFNANPERARHSDVFALPFADRWTRADHEEGDPRAEPPLEHGDL